MTTSTMPAKKTPPKPLSILMVADVSIARVIGGAERALYEYSTRLAGRGHQVHLLTRRLARHDADHEEINGVREHRFAFRETGTLSALYDSAAKSRRLFESLCKQTSFDVINFHQPFSALGVCFSGGSRPLRKIYTCHSLSFEEFISRNPRPAGLAGRTAYQINAWLRRQAERYVLDCSDAAVVLSDFTAAKLRKHHKMRDHKIHRIPGGVDLERFRPGGDRRTLREKFSIPQDKVVLFTVRNLVARMGLGNLLAALAEVAERLPQVYLVIGGRGPLQGQLAAQARRLKIQDRVRFAGFIPEPDLPDYYRLADLFVLPTLELEGFGLVTLEALASGLPVLGTPVGGTSEILARLDPDLLFADASPAAMAARISQTVAMMAESPAYREVLAERCRRFAETRYSWTDKIEELENLFQERP